jgi:Spy/CpxP family protein refolding chaperone
MERLQKFLKLSDDQTAQIKTIMADERTKMEALRSNGAAPRDNRAQMMAIHQDGETKIHALLTPDQQKKYDDMQARMRERMEERGGRGPGGPGGPGGDNPPPPPPPPPAPSQQ